MLVELLLRALRDPGFSPPLALPRHAPTLVAEVWRDGVRAGRVHLYDDEAYASWPGEPSRVLDPELARELNATLTAHLPC